MNMIAAPEKHAAEHPKSINIILATQ